MGKVLCDKNSGRTFERLSRWNAINYTIVSRKSTFAAYTDNYNSKDDKLFLTYFVVDPIKYPFKRFEQLATPLTLDDHSLLSMKDKETGYFLEVDNTEEKVRLYKELTYEN